MGLSVCVSPIRLYLDVQVLESSRISTQQFHGVFGKEAYSEEAFHSLVVCPLYHLNPRDERGDEKRSGNPWPMAVAVRATHTLRCILKAGLGAE